MPFLIPLWAFFTSKIGMYVLFAVAALGAVWWFIAHEQNIGWRKALTHIETNDKKAGEQADEGAIDVDRCYDAGGVWISSTGKCKFGKRP